ncbi:hypothetical protein [Variovorax sp. EBFNA2]|uniref:hypothetical protein n=1 Tax=Variovorax sp. EBFNA2 TaxID=3342097 RepID=UPI0029BFBB15|nr:hypothetical protein [Variovorax boronicumulans]WPG35349.1 hypothetical protein RZE79_17840 [Variovorax boronicumulans]
MEIRINLDLEAAVAAALTPEKLGPILDKHLAEAIKDAISEVTGYNSEFRKALKNQLGAVLPHGLAVDDVAKFQQVLNQSLASLVGGMNAESINTALRKVAGEALPDVPAVVKLSELMQHARVGFRKDQHEPFYALLETSDYGTHYLYLHGDPAPGSSSGYGSSRSREDGKYQAQYRLSILKEGEVYALKLDGRQITPASRPDVISRFDAILMSMYVGRTRLEIDIDADDVEAAAAEQFD